MGGGRGVPGWGTHVHPWLIQVNVWQNQYSIVKQNKVKNFFKKDGQSKSNISLSKCHIALENMWVIFKYLLILISNIIPR